MMPITVPLRVAPTVTQTGTGWRAFRPSSTFAASTSTPTVVRFGVEHPFLAMRIAGFPSSSFSNNYAVNLGPVAISNFELDAEL